MNEIKKKIEEKYNEIKIPQELEIAIQNSIQAINDSMSAIFPEEFKEGFIRLAEIGTRSAEHFDQITSIYKGHIEKLKTSVEIFRNEFPEALTGLAKHGWYFNYDIVPRLPAESYRKIKEKKIEEVDKILSEEYENNLGLIETDYSIKSK